MQTQPKSNYVSVYQHYLDCCEKQEYPRWIRNVVTKPNILKQWTYWQYSNRGVLDGYTGSEKFIDLNVFYGNEEDWNNL